MLNASQNRLHSTWRAGVAETFARQGNGLLLKGGLRAHLGKQSVAVTVDQGVLFRRDREAVVVIQIQEHLQLAADSSLAVTWQSAVFVDSYKAVGKQQTDPSTSTAETHRQDIISSHFCRRELVEGIHEAMVKFP